MPSLNFDKRFAAVVRAGKKKQTIRAIGKRKYEAEQTLYLFMGMRTKHCRRLGQARCTRVTLLRRNKAGWWMRSRTMTVGLDCDRQLLPPDLESLARHDGFASLEDFKAWFARYPVKQDFYLIEWDGFEEA